MRLAVHDSITGDRVAVLVHGIQSDHRAWHRVAAALHEDGFRVVTVDLAGHGVSPRSRRYSPAAWADDVVESLEPVVGDGIDLLVGHSLGALVASRVGDRIRPRAAVYIDPAFGFPRGLHGIALKAVFALSPRPNGWTLRRLNPRWGDDDVDLELATLALWDRRTLFGFTRTSALRPPDSLVAPSLVVLAERSMLIGVRDEAALRELGMTVERVPVAGHTVFRDDHAAFMMLLRDWVARHAPRGARADDGSDRP
ncbi:MAG: alpha/beta fold hydrolase [Pseudolysinimonas sp.]|uniref:alpha/beta fold hydrolase n=1 Tax=Pseudolysinimonas sp. TaxID=2680009 RepID=UPI00326672CD